MMSAIQCMSRPMGFPYASFAGSTVLRLREEYKNVHSHAHLHFPNELDIRKYIIDCGRSAGKLGIDWTFPPALCFGGRQGLSGECPGHPYSLHSERSLAAYLVLSSPPARPVSHQVGEATGPAPRIALRVDPAVRILGEILPYRSIRACASNVGWKR